LSAVFKLVETIHAIGVTASRHAPMSSKCVIHFAEEPRRRPLSACLVIATILPVIGFGHLS
jgi:hypothetical protein